MATTAVAVPDNPVECQEFLGYLQLGFGPRRAGEAVGWSHLQIMAALDDEEFSELIAWSRQLIYEDIETVLLEKAKGGNQRAIEMVLYNKKPDEWRPPTQRVKVDRLDAPDQRIVISVRHQIDELLASHGAAALQPGGALDQAIETTATDGPIEG